MLGMYYLQFKLQVKKDLNILAVFFLIDLFWLVYMKSRVAQKCTFNQLGLVH